MTLTFIFFFNSALLGIGLAMDAFTASLANGMSEPCMCKKRMCEMAGSAFIPSYSTFTPLKNAFHG